MPVYNSSQNLIELNNNGAQHLEQVSYIVWLINGITWFTNFL